ncbi:DUF3793 family protein [Clostridium sp. MB40-C1]|uniref:DUF3793 family protein n=1 Tax=Clostridium sp. MB40-C1 TaxID=3070996 RepID=UPI0027DFC5F6|nr:DUF3793 family protein [Clostridium sp. MB40-C1]WMJ79448.1 DUF3793 family protein [Clostridium sp. MB40-C1]
MDNLKKYRFMNMIDNFNNRDYLIATILYSAAPTIAKHKPSYLIIFHNKGKRKLNNIWKIYKEDIYKELNISFYELKNSKDSTAVLFYNDFQMQEVLKDEINIKFLKQYGYKSKMSLKQCLFLLKTRYYYNCPNEIGIFLGYPLEDVIEFMNGNQKKAIIFGYWKVYHNPSYALKIFEKYDLCREKVINLISNKVEFIDILKKI